MEDVSTTQTDGRLPVSRNGQGRFTRDLAHVERDARACLLSSQGWSQSAIAAELGYANRGEVSKAIKRVLAETARETGTELLREQQLAEMNELRRVMWDRVNNPPPAVDRLGRIVVDDNGEPVPDVQAQAAAAATIIRAAERIARLRGLDAPKRSVSMNAGDIDALISMAQTEIQRLAEERAEDDARVRVIAATPGEVLD